MILGISDYITTWWDGLSPQMKWTIFGGMIALVFVIWIVLKSITFFIKVFLTCAIVGGAVFLLIDQTDNLPMWINMFPSWDSYSIWEKGGLIVLLGFTIILTMILLKFVAKKTLFSHRLNEKHDKTKTSPPPSPSGKEIKTSSKKCKKRGGVYNFSTKMCQI